MNDAADPDRTLVMLARRRRLIDGEQQRALLAGESAQTLAELAVDPEALRALAAEATVLCERAARILGDGPLDDPAERTLREAVDAGQLAAEQVALTLIDGPASPAWGGETVVVGPEAATLQARPDVPTDATRLGRYPVLGALGEGGMGQVLRVFDEALGREVAAKVIRGQADALQLRKFVQEARVTGQLEHPAIVPAYELGRSAEGRLYLTMQRVSGQELTALIEAARAERAASGRRGAERGGLPAGLLRLLQVWLKVCEGVAYAHSQGVIHRDLKPANIMTGAFGEALVMDWGLAKLLGDAVDADPLRSGLLPDLAGSRELPLQTLDGAVMGTPTYMPPEQAEGQIAALDARADIYALGAILYELLALAPPYEGTDAWDVLDQVRAGPPPPPSERVAGAWSVPWELEAVVTRAMARDVGQRYPDVPALAADVEAFLAGHAVSAADYTPWQLALKFARRHWRSLSTAAVALLSLIGALAYGMHSAQREAAAVRKEERKTRDALGRAEAALALAEAEHRTAQEMGDVERLTAAQRQARRALFWTPAERRGEALSGELAHPPSRQRLEAALAAIERWRAEVDALIARRARYAAALASLPQSADPWTGLRRRIYGQLLAGVDALPALVNGVERRRQRYRQILQRADDAAAWRALGERLAASKRYAGTRPFPPQLGLRPLGPDPGSGLEELAHLDSGEPVSRDPDSGLLRLTDSSGIVFVLIPAGRYAIGSDAQQAAADEKPAITVQLDAFLIAKTELTQAQWVALGGVNESHIRAGEAFGQIRPTPRHPVEQVYWSDGVERLASRGLVLPTEIQWEAAARGGRPGPWWTGAEPRKLAAAENLADMMARYFVRNLRQSERWTDAQPLTAPVASYRLPHPFGLHDTLGNVREWCRDPYLERAYDRPQAIDRQGRAPRGDAPASLRVFRGGSWYYPAAFARVSRRSRAEPDFRDMTIGCRPSRPLVR